MPTRATPRRAAVGWAGPAPGRIKATSRYAPAGTGANTASWTFQNLDPTAQYQVYATWTAYGNHATNAPYTVYDGSTALGTVQMNQQFAPDEATTFDGQEWQSLGVYQAASGTLKVQLSDNTNGYVVADAIRLVEVTPPTAPVTLVDNSDPGYAETGSSWLGWTGTGAYQGDERYAPAGTGTNTATWTFQNLDATKHYEVYATWTAYGNHATDAPYTVYDGSTALGTVNLNQQVAPNSTTIDDWSWQSVGVYSPASGTLTVQLSDDANGYVVADAVRLVELPPEVLQWDPAGANLGGNGTWDTTSQVWRNAQGQMQTWQNGDNAVFSGTAGTVSISGSISADSITFQTSGYTLQGGTIAIPSEGATIDVESTSATISSAVVANGILTETGSGTLALTGNVSGSGAVPSGTTMLEGYVPEPDLSTAESFPNTAPVSWTAVSDPRAADQPWAATTAPWSSSQFGVVDYNFQIYSPDGYLAIATGSFATQVIIDGTYNSGWLWDDTTCDYYLSSPQVYFGMGPNGDGWHDVEVQLAGGEGQNGLNATTIAGTEGWGAEHSGNFMGLGFAIGETAVLAAQNDSDLGPGTVWVPNGNLYTAFTDAAALTGGPGGGPVVRVPQDLSAYAGADGHRDERQRQPHHRRRQQRIDRQRSGQFRHVHRRLGRRPGQRQPQSGRRGHSGRQRHDRLPGFRHPDA